MSQSGAQDQALQVIQQVFALATQGRLSYGDLSAVQNVLIQAKNYEMSAYLYQTWLTNTKSPMAYIVHADFGDVLVAANDIPRARASFQSALQLNPNFERVKAALAKLPLT